MNLKCPAFSNGEQIPKEYTCEGGNSVPPLKITDIPEGTQSLALICDDPDAPMGIFVHWVAWNIPPGTDEINGPAGISGTNDFGGRDYGGPCPPKGHGVHHYHFKLYALSKMLDLREGSRKAGLEAAMEGSILEKTELMGTYERK